MAARNILVVAPHPDDETLGPGGTIGRHVREGDRVWLYVVTQTYEPEWPARERLRRQKEVERAADVLGIKRVIFGGFPTAKLNAVPSIELTGAIRKVFDEATPSVVYLPPRGDLHRDHREVFEAGLVAARPLPQARRVTVLSYEMPTTSRFSWDETPLGANYYIDVSETIDLKLKALRCYRSELRAFPHPRSVRGVKLFARERGISIGCEYAECFQLVRKVASAGRDLL